MATVEIEVQNQYLTIIRSGKAEFNLNGLDADEYPHLPQIEEHHAIQIPTDLLKNLIRQTVFAVSASETRPILTGVNWKVENGELLCTATDSHRLALRKAKLDIPEDSSYNVVIPGKATELSKILDDNQELVDIVITETSSVQSEKRIVLLKIA